MTSRITKVVLAVTALFLMTGASFAQSPWWGQRDSSRWGYQNNDRQKEYDHGQRDGRGDREHGRAFHPRHNDEAYMNGYRAGFGHNGGGWQGRRDRDNDHDRDDRRRGDWGNRGNGPNGAPGGYGGNNAQSVAYNNGYQEGMRYGAADKNNGHSNRPTYSSTYQKGTSGYNSSYGSETAYKHSFQDGFRSGYERGYSGAGYRR